MSEPLSQLSPDMPIVFGGNRVTRVPAALAAAFAPGDQLLVVQSDGACCICRRPITVSRAKP